MTLDELRQARDAAWAACVEAITAHEHAEAAYSNKTVTLDAADEAWLEADRRAMLFVVAYKAVWDAEQEAK